jgi:hypothetical protein
VSTLRRGCIGIPDGLPGGGISDSGTKSAVDREGNAKANGNVNIHGLRPYSFFKGGELVVGRGSFLKVDWQREMCILERRERFSVSDGRKRYWP